MDSLAFLESAATKVFPVYVLAGDEDFLKRQVRAALQIRLLGAEDDSFGMSSYPGDKASFAAVHDELHTLPFLSSCRLVVIEGADPFLTRHRSALEKYVGDPAPSGVLVLEVKSFPATTRLAKLIDPAANITCKAPPAQRLPEWCTRWLQAQHGKQLAAPAARLLLDLVGPDMGQLDQELAKLAVYAGEAKRIDSNDVDQLVGASRMENLWKIFDAIGEGQGGAALAILGRLFEQGEDPIRILAAFSLQLRRLAQAYRRNRQGQPLALALSEVGVPPFATRGAEQQLRHLGRRRAERLYDWLLETDLGLKGSSALPPRTLLERLVVRLAATRMPA
jgi:DNA polymerase-3 subunit delta